MFSYGSGLASSMFSIKVIGPISNIVEAINLTERLKSRIYSTPEFFVETMNKRSNFHIAPYSPTGEVNALFKNTFYIDNVDNEFRRKYAFK